MDGRLTPFGLFVKWLLVPAIVAAIGYLIIGPSLGRDILKRIPAFSKPSGPTVEIEARPR